MFDKFKSMGEQLKLMQRLMQDKKFQAFLMNPKVQELLRDPEFQAIAQSKDIEKMKSHPKFAAMMKDPELLQAIQQLVMGSSK